MRWGSKRRAAGPLAPGWCVCAPALTAASFPALHPLPSNAPFAVSWSGFSRAPCRLQIQSPQRIHCSPAFPNRPIASRIAFLFSPCASCSLPWFAATACCCRPGWDRPAALSRLALFTPLKRWSATVRWQAATSRCGGWAAAALGVQAAMIPCLTRRRASAVFSLRRRLLHAARQRPLPQPNQLHERHSPHHPVGRFCPLQHLAVGQMAGPQRPPGHVLSQPGGHSPGAARRGRCAFSRACGHGRIRRFCAFARPGRASRPATGQRAHRGHHRRDEARVRYPGRLHHPQRISGV